MFCWQGYVYFRVISNVILLLNGMNPEIKVQDNEGKV